MSGKTIMLLLVLASMASMVLADSQGVFELKLKRFTNVNEKDANGHCCEGFRTSNGRCTGFCQTRFRVCLQHYQTNIDPSHECTFGETLTPVLGNNVANLDTVRFPLDFKWPVSVLTSYFNFSYFVRNRNMCQIKKKLICHYFFFQGTFSLIIEAWHESNNTAAQGKTRKNINIISWSLFGFSLKSLAYIISQNGLLLAVLVSDAWRDCAGQITLDLGLSWRFNKSVFRGAGSFINMQKLLLSKKKS